MRLPPPDHRVARPLPGIHPPGRGRGDPLVLFVRSSRAGPDPSGRPGTASTRAGGGPVVNWTRRDLLAATATAAALSALGGCEKILSTATQGLGESVPDHVAVPSAGEIDPAHHLLSRAGYGPWPGDIEYARSIGTDNWIEQQLDPQSVNDTAC